MKKAVSFVVAFAAMLMAAAPVVAGEREGAISISPFVGGYTFDGRQHLRTTPTYGLRLGYDLSDSWEVEGTAHFLETQNKETRLYYKTVSYRVDFLYNFLPDGPLVPYLAAGGGGLTYGRDGVKINGGNTDATVDAGLGLKYFMTDSVALRGDARQIFALESPKSPKYNWEYSAGVTFLFGGHNPAAAAVAAPTPAGKQSEQAQDPAPAAVAAESPDTATKIAVLSAEAVKPAAETEQLCVNLNVEFGTGKADILPPNYAQLAKAGAFIKDHPHITWLIEGHADNIGADAYNLKLSERRALQVKNYLVREFGIDPTVLAVKGYGSSKPIAENTTSDGRQMNRRVVIDPACK